MAVFAGRREKPANAGGNFPKYIGYFDGQVVGINPTPEEYFDIYQRALIRIALHNAFIAYSD